MERLYVFLTDDIRPIGGMQLYVAGKAKYLQEHDWRVKIIYSKVRRQIECKVDVLKQFVDGGFYGLSRPPYMWGKFAAHRMLDLMEDYLSAKEYSRIVVESNTDWSSQWGEMVAERIGAVHICMLCNETYRSSTKHYMDHLPFYRYKLNRNELWCISETSYIDLFGADAAILPEKRRTFTAASLDPVQDVRYDESGIPGTSDWTICHFGRAEKEYVENVIDDLGSLARKYPQKKICIVFIGDVSCRREQINRVFATLRNVTLVEMGDMVPVPRGLLLKADAVIASAGCAAASSAIGAVTIVGSADDGYSNGVLGLDTFDIWHRPENLEPAGYDRTLERVLLGSLSRTPEYCWEGATNSSLCYERQLQEMSEIAQDNVYYGRSDLLRGRVSLKDRMGSCLNFIRNTMSRNMRD